MITKTHAEFLEELTHTMESRIAFYNSNDDWDKGLRFAYRQVLNEIEQFQAEQKKVGDE